MHVLSFNDAVGNKHERKWLRICLMGQRRLKTFVESKTYFVSSLWETLLHKLWKSKENFHLKTVAKAAQTISNEKLHGTNLGSAFF